MMMTKATRQGGDEDNWTMVISDYDETVVTNIDINEEDNSD